MQTDTPEGREPPKGSFKGLILGVALVLGVSFAGYMSCKGGEDNLDVKPVIGDGDQYQVVLAKARELSKDPLEKIERGEDLSEEDKRALTASANQFQALVDFEPKLFAPHLALGQIYLELGDPKAANEHLMQCLSNLPENHDSAIETIEAETRCALAQARYKVGNFEDALTEIDLALKAFNKNPKYLITRAEVLCELRRPSEAKLELEKALKIAPENPRGKRLLKFIEKTQAQ